MRLTHQNRTMYSLMTLSPLVLCQTSLHQRVMIKVIRKAVQVGRERTLRGWSLDRKEVPPLVMVTNVAAATGRRGGVVGAPSTRTGIPDERTTIKGMTSTEMGVVGGVVAGGGEKMTSTLVVGVAGEGGLEEAVMVRICVLW